MTREANCSVSEKHEPHTWGIEFESEGQTSSAVLHCSGAPVRARRGTTNRDVRGGTPARRARRAWLLSTYASDVPGCCRCYRCGHLLYNPDDPPSGYTTDGDGELRVKITQGELWVLSTVYPMTVDRIIPGCQGGTYRRTNIRPACGGCNSETGGRTRGKVARK